MADKTYVGKAALTYVRYPDGRAEAVEKNQPLPGGLDQADIDRLVEAGFLAEADLTVGVAVVTAQQVHDPDAAVKAAAARVGSTKSDKP